MLHLYEVDLDDQAKKKNNRCGIMIGIFGLRSICYSSTSLELLFASCMVVMARFGVDMTSSRPSAALTA